MGAEGLLIARRSSADPCWPCPTVTTTRTEAKRAHHQRKEVAKFSGGPKFMQDPDVRWREKTLVDRRPCIRPRQALVCCSEPIRPCWSRSPDRHGFPTRYSWSPLAACREVRRYTHQIPAFVPVPAIPTGSACGPRSLAACLN